MIGDDRIDRTLQRSIAAADRVAHPVEAAVSSQLLELIVQVEHDRRQRSTARDARGLRMLPDEEERHAAEAETEVW